MNEWLPIETAPKDGTPILVYQPAHERELEYLTRNNSGRETRVTKFDEEVYVCQWDGDSWVEAQGERYYRYFPSHWMPLPAPPTK